MVQVESNTRRAPQSPWYCGVGDCVSRKRDERIMDLPSWHNVFVSKSRQEERNKTALVEWNSGRAPYTRRAPHTPWYCGVWVFGSRKRDDRTNHPGWQGPCIKKPARRKHCPRGIKQQTGSPYPMILRWWVVSWLEDGRELTAQDDTISAKGIKESSASIQIAGELLQRNDIMLV